MSEQKICPECNDNLDLNKFKKTKRKDKTYYSTICQRCHNKKLASYRNEYYKKKRLEDPNYSKKYTAKYNKSEHGKKKIKEYSSAHSEENIKRNKDWYKENKDRKREKSKEWIKNNPEKYKIIYTKANRKRQENPLSNFAMRIRCAVKKSFRKTFIIKREKTFSLLGYSNVELHNHLEKYIGKLCEDCKLIEISLLNSNIDHIIPMCTATCEEDIISLNQIINLRLICRACNANKISNDLKMKEEYNGRLAASNSEDRENRKTP